MHKIIKCFTQFATQVIYILKLCKFTHLFLYLVSYLFSFNLGLFKGQLQCIYSLNSTL